MSCKAYKFIDLDESEEQVDSGSGELVAIWVANASSSARYLKIYDGLASAVTVGTTTPNLTFLIPPSNGGFYMRIPSNGWSYSSGVTVAATTGVADADTGAPGANEVIGAVFYVSWKRL